MVNRHTNPKCIASFLALMALAISPVQGGAPQAVSPQDAEPEFSGLLPRSPLSPALRTRDAQPIPASSQWAAGEPPSTQVWGEAPQAGSTQDAELKFPSLLPRSLLSPAFLVPQGEKGKWEKAETDRGRTTGASQTASGHQSTAMSLAAQPLAQGYNGPRTTAYGPTKTEDQGPPLAMASTLFWGRVLQALGIQDAELRFPSFLPPSPFSSAVLAAEGEKEQREKRDRGQTTVATLGVQSGVQGYNGPGTTDQAQTPIDNRESKIDNPHNELGTSEHGQTREGSGVRSQETSYNREPTADNAQTPIDNQQSRIDNRIRVGLRDPFKLPPPPRPAQEENDSRFARNRPPGLRGLLIGQLRLKGVVRDSATHKMIAVLTNSSNRAYFLREGEAVYDGVVNKITPDAVYFKENDFDAKHETHFRQVVKTLNPAPGEVR